MNVLTQVFGALVLSSHAPEAEDPNPGMGFLEQAIGVDIPDSVMWIAIGVIVVIVIALIAWGFFKELKKK